jgi:hypothetical protein
VYKCNKNGDPAKEVLSVFLFGRLNQTCALKKKNEEEQFGYVL